MLQFNAGSKNERLALISKKLGNIDVSSTHSKANPSTERNYHLKKCQIGLGNL